MDTVTSAFKSQVPSFDCKNIGFTKMAFSGVDQVLASENFFQMKDPY